MLRKKKASDRAIGQQGNYKAESNSHFRVSAFQHAHLLQACLMPDFEMQSRWKGCEFEGAEVRWLRYGPGLVASASSNNFN